MFSNNIFGGKRSGSSGSSIVLVKQSLGFKVDDVELCYQSLQHLCRHSSPRQERVYQLNQGQSISGEPPGWTSEKWHRQVRNSLMRVTNDYQYNAVISRRWSEGYPKGWIIAGWYLIHITVVEFTPSAHLYSYTSPLTIKRRDCS